MTLSPVLLALLGLLLSALGALLAGGVAWGRFAAALDRLREDHRDLRTEVQRAVDAVSGLAVARTRLDAAESEVRDLRASKHQQASAITRLETELSEVRRTAERALDAAETARASHHPHA